MPKPTWKSVERAILKYFNTTRTGPTGRNGPDGITEDFSIEVKHRKELPGWLHDCIKQAEENAVPGTMPVLVLHEERQRYDDSIVLVAVRLGDVEWM